MAKRERWPFQTLFIFAAIGSAVGLGNIWRFPYLVGKYGGGAFLFPYLIALMCMGFPLLVLEIAIGQKMQLGSVGAFNKIHRKFSGIGFAALLCSFGISCYYAVVMGWCILYFYYSFQLSWGNEPSVFFQQNILHVNYWDYVSLQGLIGLFLSWIFIFFCVRKGIKSVSAVVKFTMPLPIILLIILLFRTLWLPGALDGLKFYLTPNYTALFDPEVWVAAIGQIFFTLTLGIGVMITYASYKPKSSDIVKCALITAFADLLIAFTAGLVVFMTIGYMSLSSDDSIQTLAQSGPSLAFIVFPKALSLIPGASFFAAIFFLMLITLAIDSLFSLTEALVAFFSDHFPKIDKGRLAFLVCAVCFAFGLIFITERGINYLDILDHYITSYGLILVIIFQCLVVGWYYDIEKLRLSINKVSTMRIGKIWNVSIRTIIPIVLLSLLIRFFYQDIIRPYEGYPLQTLWIFGWGVILLMFTFSVLYSLLNKN